MAPKQRLAVVSSPPGALSVCGRRCVGRALTSRRFSRRHGEGIASPAEVRLSPPTTRASGGGVETSVTDDPSAVSMNHAS
jgi:hypothetical protein